MEQQHLQGETQTPADDSRAPTNGRWVRPKQGRLLAGVAEGIGRALDVPGWLVRVAFVAMAFADGIGILGYLAAWALMPEEGTSQTLADDARRGLGKIDRPSKVAGVILIGLGTLIALGNTGLLGSPLVAALVLGVIGFVLIRQED